MTRSYKGQNVKSYAKTTETSLEVIQALVELDGAQIDRLSEYLGLSPSTIHRHLVTLRNHDFVIQEDGVYKTGLRFLTIGGYARRKTVAYSTIKEKVDRLAEETGERSQFIVEEHGQRVYLYTEVGQSSVQTGARTGRRGKMHTSAAGKAILANLPEAYVQDIIDRHGLPPAGPNSITSKSKLFEHLKKIRERGYAYNFQETTAGVHAVGAAVINPDNTVLGALSVAGPEQRLKGERLTKQLPEQILAAVNELELHVKYTES